MLIQSQPQTPKMIASQPSVQKQANQAPEQPEDGFKKGSDDTSNVWKAIRAIPSSLAGAVICGAGIGAASVVDIPRITGHAAASLVKTPYIGRNLKVLTGILMPFASVASMVLSPVAGALYGLVTGFANGAEKGFGEAVSKAAHDVKRYHSDVTGSAIEWLKDHQTGTLPEGEKPYDIPLSGAAKGLVGGVVNGAVAGVAATGLAAVYSIPGAVRAEAELWKSDIPLPFKVVGTPIVPVAVGLAACLAPAAGVLYGVGVGAKDSYQKSIGESIVHTGETIKEANSGLAKAIFK